MSVTRSVFNHALKVFTESKCGSLGDYYDLYLTTDVLLLASVFEAFRKVCYQTYGLDCACYFTASNFSGDICKTNLKLLTNNEHLDLLQRTRRHVVGLRAPILRPLFSPSEPTSYML